MALSLIRVDERLIHGQVVLGWGHELRPDRYLVVDDDLAASEWEQELYRLGANGAAVVFASVDEAAGLVPAWSAAEERSVLLTRDVGTMRRLADTGVLTGQKVNLGGIHHARDREEVLTYVHLSDQDRIDLRAISAAGAEVTARDLPDAHRVDLATLLGDR